MLRFYDPVNPVGSCRAQSVYLTTLLLGRLSPPSGCTHCFTSNLQLPFLNERKGENDHRKFFMINLHERILTTQQGYNLKPPSEALRLAMIRKLDVLIFWVNMVVSQVLCSSQLYMRLTPYLPYVDRQA